MKLVAVVMCAGFVFVPVTAANSIQVSGRDIDFAMSADNAGSSVPVVFQGVVTCDNANQSTIGPVTLAPQETRGEVPDCIWNTDWPRATFSFKVGTDEMDSAGVGIQCTGFITNTLSNQIVTVVDGSSDDRCKSGNSVQGIAGQQPKFVNFEKNDANVYNFHLTSVGLNPPPTPVDGVKGAVNVNLTPASADAGTPRAKKVLDYTILKAHRVTAMAKNFLKSPGDIINIHAYGPDRAECLAKAKHVRVALQSEIAGLGGNPAEYPVFVVYAGDPDHKAGVHVTIHQHDASSIAIP